MVMYEKAYIFDGYLGSPHSYFICKAVCKIAPATPCTLNTSIMLNKYTMWFVFLAAQSSSRSLVVGPSVRWSVCPSVQDLCEKGTLIVSNGN